MPDWRVSQRQAVEVVGADSAKRVWVASAGEEPAGVVAARLHTEDRQGEVYMITVDPDYQRRGSERTLMTAALTWMREAGMAVAMVETGAIPAMPPHGAPMNGWASGWC